MVDPTIREPLASELEAKTEVHHPAEEPCGPDTPERESVEMRTLAVF